MTERDMDPEIVRRLLNVRDDLGFWLTESDPRTEGMAPLWEAYRLLVNGLEEVKRSVGFIEEGCTITLYKPDKT